VKAVTRPTVSVVIPSIPSRTLSLARALVSVTAQTLTPDEVIVKVDHEALGAPANRQAALEAASSEWVAFLDDDDELEPVHLERCLRFALGGGFDLVYPWFHGLNSTGLFAVPAEDGDGMVEPLGRRFTDDLAEWLCERPDHSFIPVTVLVKRQLALDAGGFTDADGLPTPAGGPTCEDWALWRRLLKAGARFGHLPERTWRWNPSDHTAGQSWRSLGPGRDLFVPAEAPAAIA
jgi:hypothetical protein